MGKKYLEKQNIKKDPLKIKKNNGLLQKKWTKEHASIKDICSIGLYIDSIYDRK